MEEKKKDTIDREYVDASWANSSNYIPYWVNYDEVVTVTSWDSTTWSDASIWSDIEPPSHKCCICSKEFTHSEYHTEIKFKDKSIFMCGECTDKQIAGVIVASEL